MSRAQAMAMYPYAGQSQSPRPARISRLGIVALLAGSGALLYYLSGRSGSGSSQGDPSPGQEVGGGLCERCRGQIGGRTTAPTEPGDAQGGTTGRTSETQRG